MTVLVVVPKTFVQGGIQTILKLSDLFNVMSFLSIQQHNIRNADQKLYTYLIGVINVYKTINI